MYINISHNSERKKEDKQIDMYNNTTIYWLSKPLNSSLRESINLFVHILSF